MRFTKEKWPVLWGLSESKNIRYMIENQLFKFQGNPYENEKGFKSFIDFYDHMTAIKRNDIFITEPIRWLVDDDPKMVPILEKEVCKPEFNPEFSGTISYIVDGECFTVMLDIISKERFKTPYNLISIALFMGDKFGAFAYGGDTGDGIAHLGGTIAGTEPFATAVADSYMFCKQLLYFMDNCAEKTQYKLTRQGKRIKTPTDKYTTEFNNPNIQVIDSTFYTTTISGAFQVTGHWRMQPYGPRNAYRKLTWIKEFEKTGITRTATIASQSTNK